MGGDPSQADRDELAERVRWIIRRDGFAPGERLGSERGLSEALGVPRSALRHALEALERRGEVRRAMGRAGGVFVDDGKIDRHLNTIEGVPRMLQQQGHRPGTVVLHSEIGIATPGERRRLALGPDAHVFRLVRRRDADDAPLSIDRMTLPCDRLPGIQRLDLTGSVYELIRERYGIELSHADETIDVVAASAEQAGVLGIAAGDALLALRRVSFDAAGRPIEASDDVFRADRTRISMRRVGASWKRLPRR
ncbi:GntR family transcriptional regulator [Microbacterium indicum]|uniref:GntR family transcriptional regulator n=1 Tax=Microbacterium indicum TaxID=358100 RepID=UPI0003F4F0D1|nr:GntR family transcriptional regulator [Microbacterium indicum]